LKKIGIISHYYKSKNYGGVLQAHALQKTVERLNTECVQISYNVQISSQRLWYRLFRLVLNPQWIILAIRRRLVKKGLMPIPIPSEEIQNEINKREAVFRAFQERIPHTIQVYYEGTMEHCGEEFDTLVTGSDQVWNFAFYRPACFLNFAAPGQKKISYAASVSMDSFTMVQAAVVRHYLRDFSAVSVREAQTVDLLRPLSPVEPVWTLDPTLLLTAEEWDEICAERMIDEPYLFCYFLGIDAQKCALAKDFTHQNGWKIVTIPYLHGYDEKEPSDFGDYRWINISPEQFLSLVKHASYVMTDSFHACVFSNIYKRQYAVFNRNKSGEMNSRIYSLTQMMEQQERFCDTDEKMTTAYLSSLAEIDYSRTPEEFEKRKAISLAYLEESI